MTNCSPSAGCGRSRVRAEAMAELREAGMKIVLTTGFARHTQNMILESLGWMGVSDLSLCPSDAGRAVPYPDMILTALLALDLDDVRSVLVAGDTVGDIRAGQRAGAGLTVGVLSGYHEESALTEPGPPSSCPPSGTSQRWSVGSAWPLTRVAADARGR